MKKNEKIKWILLHLNCIFGISFLALVILDWYNPLMGFLTNSFSLFLMMAFCVSSILAAVLSIRGKDPHTAG